MLRRLCCGLVLLALATPLAAQDAPEVEAGQEALDQAVDIKLSASSYRDLTQVIGLCQQAIRKGLGDENREIADRLMASAYFQRGSIVGEAIFTTQPPPADWRQMRQLALVDLQKALDYKADLQDALLLVGQLESLPEGDRKHAVEVLEQAAKLGDDTAKKAEALMRLAAIHPDLDRKRAALEEASELLPNDARLLRAQAEISMATNQNEKALLELDKALEIDPKNVPTLEARAAVLAMLKRYDDALAAYDRIIQIDPDTAGHYLLRARVNLLKGNMPGVVEDADKALDRERTNASALLLKTQALNQMGKEEEALGAVDELLNEAPGLSTALRTRAVVLAGMDRLDEAVADLEIVSAQEPTDAGVWFQLAMLYSATSHLKKSVDAYTKTIEFDPNNWLALRGRADTLLSLGEQAPAVTDYEAALKLQPEESGVLNNLAWVLATSPDAAIRDGKRAIELATKACELTEYKQAHILSTLAAAYAESGDFEKAIEWSTKAVETSDESMRENLQKELDSYVRHEPWRERQEQPAEPAKEGEPHASTAQKP